MSYLYLNFVEFLESGIGNKSKKDYYSLSLKNQYENIRRKIGSSMPDTLQPFVECAFPTETPMDYHISVPSIIRELKTTIKGNQYINNLVIRPSREYLNSMLPANYDVIFIGDLYYGSVIEIRIKGIELIDSNVAKYGEKKIRCIAATAFSKRKITIASGAEIEVPIYSTRDLKDGVLTNDFIIGLCDDVFPVPNKEEVIKTLHKWEEYVQFRKYYLGQQSERNEVIDSIEVCDSYILPREAYKNDEDRLSQFLLDDVKDFSKGDQVILSSNVQGSEMFPLICVIIQKNRKTILSDVDGIHRKKPKYESNLRRFSNGSMALSTSMPKYDKDGNLMKDDRFSQYLLGDRYLFATVDRQPNLDDFIQQYEKDLSKSNSDIDLKFSNIINNELNRYLIKQEEFLKKESDSRVKEYQNELNNSLKQDIAENNDKEIANKYNYLLEKQENGVKINFSNQLTKIKNEIENLKENTKLSRDEKEKRIEELNHKANHIYESYLKELEEIKQNASKQLEEMYVQRNIDLVNKFVKSLSISNNAKLEEIKQQKKAELEIQYNKDRSEEKTHAKEELQVQLEKDKNDRIENDTIREYRIYYRGVDGTDSASFIREKIYDIKPRFLICDSRAEKVKIDRQEKALKSITEGYVKNPYLLSYLFAPAELKQISRVYEKELDWCLESLNDGQKLAVKRALASDSIFLLQGPPGTGKTQVIAEITAQLAKQGKKVLVSSETHKAIDNVFERLPKIPEIRPLRLIPSQNGKETNYSPEKLVDNFYANICGNLNKQIDRYEHFEENKAIFDEEMKKLRYEYDKILKLKIDNSKVEKKREHAIEYINKLNEQLETQRSLLRDNKDVIETYKKTQRNIANNVFSSEGANEQIIEKFKLRVVETLQSFESLNSISLDKANTLLNISVDDVKNEISFLLVGDELIGLESRKIELRNILQSLRDPDTDEVPHEGDEKYQEYKKFQNELIDIAQKVKIAQSKTNFDSSESKIFNFIPNIIQNSTLLKHLPEDITAFKIKVQSIKADLSKYIDDEVAPYENDEIRINNEIAKIQIDINKYKNEYEELSNNQGIEEYENLNTSLKQRITKFFRDFNIIREYNSDDLETAFDIIKDEWSKLEKYYKSSNEENKNKIRIYKEISRYLSQEDILEEDRRSYTRELLDNVNVFGITCTSREKFTKAASEELNKYNIDTVDIRQQGIDVVIVDEVSKSSFLDLLIPILYGKTIILVGDHRQLPPMYDLKHLRTDDLEGLDESIITFEKNQEYKDLYEESIFKKLYEQVPNDFRVMLTKQYRCHSHIMEVFNHFYGGKSNGLTIGKTQQDVEKEHGLTVRINGRTIIEPKYHVYFVDCDQKESSAYEGATSKINEQEAEVSTRLVKELNNASLNLIREKKIIVSQNGKVDERPSIGVICTYRDQANLIKNKRKGLSTDGFSGKQDERINISTVDDFQGDERDIIILSMVRNPASKYYDVDFIKQFERINVALSRARKLLIVVGSRKFLTEAGIIDLPDISGNHYKDQLNFPVYDRIIGTIYSLGRILSANDIIGE